MTALRRKWAIIMWPNMGPMKIEWHRTRADARWVRGGQGWGRVASAEELLAEADELERGNFGADCDELRAALAAEGWS